MFKLGRFAVLFAIASLSALSGSLAACECYEQPSDNRFYIGGFGGGVYSDSSKVYQYGTAFLEDIDLTLPVIAEGHLRKNSTGFGGVQIGYEWSKPSCSSWSLATAGELEVLFFQHKRNGQLFNQTVVGLDEHDFRDSFKVRTNIILANIVLAVKSDCAFGFTPYVGGGIGAARVSVHNADSFQFEPLEAGVNHFNSNRNDSSWTFAAQAKAGLRYNIFERFHLFAEYRYLYIDTNHYVLGATNYPEHAPTTSWNVKVKDTQYNSFAIGVQFDL